MSTQTHFVDAARKVLALGMFLEHTALELKTYDYNDSTFSSCQRLQTA